MNTNNNYSEIEVVALSTKDFININGGYDFTDFCDDAGFVIGTVLGAAVCAGAIVTKAIIGTVAGKTVIK